MVRLFHEHAGAGATLALAAILALPAHAAEFFTPPADCESFLTLQSSGCFVTIHWTCKQAQAGDVWISSFDADGLASTINYDREFQWIEANYTWDGVREVLSDPGDDPVSLSELLETGVDTYSFHLLRSEPGQPDRDLHVIGADLLTGQTLTIDGIDLSVTDTEFRIMNEVGEIEYRAIGNQLVWPEKRLFFLYKDKVIEGGQATTFENAPIDFIFPGEPGFNETTPHYGCGVQSKI